MAVPITRVNFIVCNYGNRSYGVSNPKFPFNNAKTKSQKTKVKRRLYKWQRHQNHITKRICVTLLIFPSPAVLVYELKKSKPLEGSFCYDP
jgi:hypothetical protein